jgi:endonuclease/exonuclease/phosphatase family metal-dependent hydrolase
MKTIAILLLNALILIPAFAADPAEHSFAIMTFNIRLNEPKDGIDAWPNRKDKAASMVRFHRADIFGVQEALHDQMMDLEERLPEFGWIGVGRDDGDEAGEYAAIFYRKDRFELLDGATFWLSETPEKKGSKGWDAVCVRIVTWGHFRERESGKEFYHFNTHFDHRGEEAREMSSHLVVEKAKEIAGSAPVLLTGDFNFPPTSPNYSILTAEEAGDPGRVYLKDARTISEEPPHGPDWSSHGFSGQGRPGRIIDFIFVSDAIKVIRHGILSDHWSGRYPSDHLPVLAEVVVR